MYRRDPRWLLGAMLVSLLMWTGILAGTATLLQASDCVSIEAQDWWKPTGSEVFRHVHLGICGPRPESQVSGVVEIPVTLQLHDNAGTRLNSVKVHVNKTTNVVSANNLNFTCSTNQCSRELTLRLNTANFPDGRQLVRIVVDGVDPDGQRVRVSLKYAWRFENNKANRNGQSWDLDTIDANGWYTGTGYARAQLTTPLTDNPGVNITAYADGSTPAAPVARSYVAVDPNFHAGYAGDPRLDVAGKFTGTVDASAEPGEHRLFIRSLQRPISTGTHAGILVVAYSR